MPLRTGLLVTVWVWSLSSVFCGGLVLGVWSPVQFEVPFGFSFEIENLKLKSNGLENQKPSS